MADGQDWAVETIPGFNNRPTNMAKSVNTGQYESEWSIGNSKWPLSGGLRYKVRVF